MVLSCTVLSCSGLFWPVLFCSVLFCPVPRQVVAPSTLVSKVFGVILGVSSGLPIGKEGPMIHAGAAIGASIASLPRIKCLEEFRNDRDR